MKLVNRALVVGVVAGAFTLAVACSSSDSNTGSSGTTSGGTSGTSGTDSGTDAAETGGGTKANGAICGGDGECMSAHCISQGNMGGSGTAGTFCTVPCATPQQNPAPECAATVFTGKCSGQSFCQVK